MGDPARPDERLCGEVHQALGAVDVAEVYPAVSEGQVEGFAVAEDAVGPDVRDQTGAAAADDKTVLISEVDDPAASAADK